MPDKPASRLVLDFGSGAVVAVIVVGLLAAAAFILTQKTLVDIEGSWSGDVRVNKDDPHYGVWLAGSELDKSTSIQVTDVKFHVKAEVPVYLLVGKR